MAVLGSIHVLWWHVQGGGGSGTIYIFLGGELESWGKTELSDALIDQILMLN